MRYGLIGSVVLHFVVLGAVVFNFATATKPDLMPAPQPPVSVEIMTPGEFSQRQAGKVDSRIEKPAALAEVKAADTPSTAKKEVAPKPVVKAAEKELLAPPPPKAVELPAPKPVETAKFEKLVEKPLPKPAKKEPEKKVAAKPLPDENKKPDEPKRVADSETKRVDTKPFDANRIASLLQKDTQQASPRVTASQANRDNPPSKTYAERESAVLDRSPNAGQAGGAFQPNKPWRPASSLQDQASGTSQGRDTANTTTDAELLFAQISQQWDLPVGGAGAENIVVRLRFSLKPDGMLAREPEVLEGARDPSSLAAADAAKRAVLRAQPFRIPPGRYESFRDNVISFDPSLMYGAARG